MNNENRSSLCGCYISYNSFHHHSTGLIRNWGPLQYSSRLLTFCSKTPIVRCIISCVSCMMYPHTHFRNNAWTVLDILNCLGATTDLWVSPITTLALVQCCYIISATTKDMHGVIYRDQPIMVFCYAPVLKFLTYYAQYYPHVKDLRLKFDCCITVYHRSMSISTCTYIKILHITVVCSIRVYWSFLVKHAHFPLCWHYAWCF